MKFFTECGLLDYSLLLGIENLTGGDYPDVREDLHKIIVGDKMYHIALIDFMQAWNWKKKWEHAIKTKILLSDSKKLSAVNPTLYGERFRKFMSREVFTLDEDFKPVRPTI